MEKELENVYKELATTLHTLYGVDKEETTRLLNEHGHEHIFNNAELIGVDSMQAVELKKICKILIFYNENREVLCNG